ncbi:MULTISPECIES: DoxX family protein [Prochlorococcus]|uniref:DoxX family protein n=1 Tax=Prochlorococcus TaxID=1218 RepID=UPI0005336F36|nr:MULTISPECIES: DoxX family protein [Prochlorococcus]KGG11885.1 hypothetical protein EV05_1086 [Prochlorococcus sp. MIT 0601]
MNKLISRKNFDFLGRVLLSAVFVNAVPIKITRFAYVSELIVDRGVPELLAPVLLVASIFCLAIGSLALVFYKNHTVGAALLLTFLVPTTLLFHLDPLQLKQVLMNLGLIGGLLIIITRSISPE